jgi:zinc/manganese transport system substrate-binding protein
MARHPPRLRFFGPRPAALVLALIVLAIARPSLAKLNVVATVPDLAALAREAGGERVEVTALLLPTQEIGRAHV